MARYKRGYSFERDVKLKFEKEGWHVIRSGGSKKPDLVLGKDGKVVIIECKVTTNDKIYLDPDEVEHLKKVSKAFGADALYAVKIKRKGWNLVDVDALKRTDKFYTYDIRDLS